MAKSRVLPPSAWLQRRFDHYTPDLNNHNTLCTLTAPARREKI
ncbi:MAG: hypothetical protein ACREOO_05815 [bacterium]